MLLESPPSPAVTLRVHVRDHAAWAWVRNVVVLAVVASIFASTRVPALHVLALTMLAAAAGSGAVLLAAPATARFGTDGVSWTHPLYARKPLFFPYNEVDELLDTDGGIRYKHVKYKHLDTEL